MDPRWRNRLLLLSALLLAISAGVHVRLYREQYRDVHVDSVLGVDLSRSFVLSVIAGTVLSLLLVLTVALHWRGRLVVTGAFAYAVGALVAYGLSRTVGLLGFEEDRWVTEAIIVKPVELAAAVLLGAVLLASRTRVARDERSSAVRGRVLLPMLALPIPLVAGIGLLFSDVTTAPAAPTGATASASGTVVIADFAFAPGALTVKVGDEVTWINNDSAPHTIANEGGLFPESDDLGQGDEFAFTYDRAGTYAYFCGIHSSMQGEVVVTD
jgi:plastocyanin